MSIFSMTCIAYAIHVNITYKLQNDWLMLYRDIRMKNPSADHWIVKIPSLPLQSNNK